MVPQYDMSKPRLDKHPPIWDGSWVPTDATKVKGGGEGAIGLLKHTTRIDSWWMYLKWIPPPSDNGVASFQNKLSMSWMDESHMKEGGCLALAMYSRRSPLIDLQRAYICLHVWTMNGRYGWRVSWPSNWPPVFVLWGKLKRNVCLGFLLGRLTHFWWCREPRPSGWLWTLSLDPFTL